MAEKMKAQVFYEPNKMTLEEVPIPKVQVDEILVRVKACGICGSDVAYYFGQSSLETPTGKGLLILGHEFSGEVVEVGDIPKRLGLFAPGDRVVLDPVQYCNACIVCKRGQVNLCEKKTVLGVSANGAFAEYCVSNYTGVHKIPDGVTYEQAALTEPLACATYGTQKMEVNTGDFCVVMGPGVIGLMMLQLVRRRGAGTVVVTGSKGDDYRLDVARKLGANAVFNVNDPASPYYVADLKAKIAEMSGGMFADAVITPTGAVEAMEMALQITGRRARVVYFGLPSDQAVIRVPALASILWDKTIRFSWLAPLVWPTALQALGTGLIDTKPLASHVMGLPDLVKAITMVRDRSDKAMKIVITP